MQYIKINTKSLGISLTNNEPQKGIIIPTEFHSSIIIDNEFIKLVYFDVLYPYREQMDGKNPHEKASYCLVTPDPWFIAIAGIMWEGLIQGLTWEVIKQSALKALVFLRTQKLAPDIHHVKKITKKSSASEKYKMELGFSWTQFSVNGKPLYELFLGLRRQFKKRRTGMRDETRRKSHAVKRK